MSVIEEFIAGHKRYLTAREIDVLRKAPLSEGISWETWVEGPRWSGIPAAIEKLSLESDVTLIYLREHKSFLSTTVLFKVSGNALRVLFFKATLLQALASAGATC